MIEWLARKGYRCTVLTTYPYYPYWQVQEPYRKKRFWYTKETKDVDAEGKITVYRCPMFVPKQPTGKKRMVSDLSFFLSGFFQLLKLVLTEKFDFVITVAPSFQLGLLGHFYKKMRHAKHIYHIQDLQIEVAQDLEMIKSQMLINWLFGLERFILNRADAVSSISEGMVSKIQKKTKTAVMLFPNWVDAKQFFPLANRNELKNQFGFLPTDKIVLYSGGIGEKQGITAILHAAQALLSTTETKFVICGSGPYKEKLKAMAEDMRLPNVIFLPLQPMAQFNAFLNMADVHLIIQKAQASDLVMPSKLTSILAVGGLALITANKGSGLFALVDKYQMGILLDAENQHALNEGITKALSLDNNSKITLNARNYSDTYLSMDKIMETFEHSNLKD